MFTLICTGVMPGCDAVFESEERDLLLTDVVRHVVEVHGVTAITPTWSTRSSAGS